MKLLLERWNKYLKESDKQLSLPLKDNEAPLPSKLLPEQENALEYAFKVKVLDPNKIFPVLETMYVQYKRKLIADPFISLISVVGGAGKNSFNDPRSDIALFPTEEELKSLNLTFYGELIDKRLPVFYDFANSGYDYDVDILRHIRTKYINRILQIASESTNGKKQAWFSPNGTNYNLNLKYEEQQP